MSRATCTKCGSEFERSEDWKVFCLPCWKKSKRQGKSFGSGDDSELVKLRLENLVLRQKVRAYQLFREPAPRIPDDMLKRLTMLCHPDRHHGSEASTKATTWLLEQRA